MYTECSRLFCTEQKIKDDAVKIWRETNDGMYWVYKGRRPEKDEFGIIGLQVAGSILRLTVLIRDGANVDTVDIIIYTSQGFLCKSQNQLL